MSKPLNAVERSIVEQFGYWEKAPQVSTLRDSKRLIIVGCGTSYYLSQTLAATFNVMGQKALAVAGNEWAKNSNAYVTPEETVHVIAVSRSGESTETIWALREAKKAGIPVTGITCEAESTLAKEADTVVYAETHPIEGIVMTVSASLMLLEGLRLAGLNIDASAVAQEAQGLIDIYGSQLDALLPGRKHFVFLGAAELHGIAQEGALKLQEMSLSFTQAYHPLEYRHGPVSLVDEGTLVVIVYHPHTASEEAILIQELQAKGAKVLAFAGAGDLSVPISTDIAAVRGLIALPLLQWFGERVAQSKGLDSSAPRHLTKVVSIA